MLSSSPVVMTRLLHPLYDRPRHLVHLFNLTGRVDYRDFFQWQRQITHARIQQLRNADAAVSSDNERLFDTVVVLEHEPAYTIGRGGKLEFLRSNMPIVDLTNDVKPNILVAPMPMPMPTPPPPPEFSNTPAPLYRVDRGGQITYHGPGQIMLYPLLNLTRYKQDLHWFVQQLQHTLTQTASAAIGEESRSHLHYHSEHTGVWYDKCKIAQIGIHMNKWQSTHGVALNVHSRILEYFQHIIPCGIRDEQLSVGTLQHYKADVKIDDVKRQLIAQTADVFNMEWLHHHSSPQTMLNEWSRLS